MRVEGTPAISADRRAAVEGACRTWINRLIDPSRRNNLLFFRELREGTLDLSSSPKDGIAALISPSSPAVKLTDLVNPDDAVAAAAKLQEIRKRAVVNQEERGLDTLFLALGMACWPASDDGRDYAAPVLLMPITVEQTGTDRRRLTLSRNGDVQPNLVLLHYLESQKVRIDPEQMTGLVEGDDHEEEFDLEPAFKYLTDAVGTQIPQFKIDPHYIIGNFSFQKMAMVRDLRELPEALVQHDIVAAMARDAGASASLRSAGSDAQLPEIDAVAPDQEFLVLDADSTQQNAIGRALAGRNGVISGPPGTGKSQTIANLICEFAARGRKVLFVAEKRAALEAVLKRLEKKGLAHLCLDLHGAEVSRRQVLERVAAGLEKIRDAQRVDASAVHQRFVERRSRLNDHARRLHLPRKPSEMSIFQLQGRLLRAQDTSCQVRWRRDALTELTTEGRHQITSLLEEATAFSSLFTRRNPSPWTHALVNNAAEAQRTHDLASEIARSVAPVIDRARVALREVGLTEGATVAEVTERVTLITDLHDFARRIDVQIFSETPHVLVTALAPAASLLSRLWATVTSPSYRAALRQVRSLSREADRSPSDLLHDVRQAEELMTRWLRVAAAGSSPREWSGDLAVLKAETSALAKAIASLSSFFAGVDGQVMTIEALGRWAESLAADALTPLRVARMRQIKAELRTLAAGEFVDDICGADPPPQTWPARFEFAWLKSCLDDAFAQEPALATFSGQTHQAVVEEFKRLDVERLELAIARVLRSHAERVIDVRNAHPEQDALMKREAGKKRRHLPLRKLVAEAPDVLTALHPCWMASPLSVSQLLPGDKQYFDAVIFDEASQVLPEDAVTSLLRGRQCVVAGDRRQLPPTTFFAAGTDDGGDDDSDTAGFESLLDVVTSIVDLPWNLDWHYRSHDESLIAYSNHHVYGNRLVTFPGAGGEPVVQHVLVPHVRDASSEESSSAEVKRVVELVLEHARTRAHETLGVITMGIAHARRVEAAIEQAVQDSPELEDFFDPKRYERFFVKNLERVQGDERDAIVLSIGYCKDASGTLPYRFGPLLSEGGERRLNVAITRARARMTVVSSFGHLDMDPGRTKAQGVHLLRGFLEYASKGGTGLTRSEGTEVPLNDFEQDVCDALRAKGIEILPQWGASKYRIDLVAQHPRRPGQFVLAIECDGASYHSSASARDRDRLRQGHLEALGWYFYRIWSTDWFLQRDKEIERAEQAFWRAVALSDNGVSVAAPSPASAPTSLSSTPVSSPADPDASGPPVIPRRASIDEYQPGELDRVVRWISATANKTDDEIVDDAVKHLGFARRGRKIEKAIRESIVRVRKAREGRAGLPGSNWVF